MKLFSKEIDKKLFKQYPKGSDLSSQVAVAKIFNPYGKGRWYLINSDPEDPNYLWAIVQMGDIVEVGSVSRNELESLRIPPFRLPLERDLGFGGVNAAELFKGLRAGKFYKAGGWTEGSENKEMLLNQAEGFEHHAEEFESAVKKADYVPAWVVAKSQRASTDLSDITHYLDGENEQREEEVEGEEEYADGGEVYVDLFENRDEMPYKLEVILDRYEDEYGEDISYQGLLDMQKDVEEVGYTFDFGLDSSPYGLRPMGVKISQLEGYDGYGEDKMASGGMMADGGDIVDISKKLPPEDLIKLLKSIDFKEFNSSDISKINNAYYDTYREYGSIKADPCKIILKKSDDGMYNIYIGRESVSPFDLSFENTEYSFKIKNLTFEDFEEGLKNAVRDNIVGLYSNYSSGSLQHIYFYGSEKNAEKFALENGYIKIEITSEASFPYYYINPSLENYDSEKRLFVHRFLYDDVEYIGISKLRSSNNEMAEGGMMEKGGIIPIEKKGDKKVATIIHDGNVFFVEYYIDNPELKHIKGTDANTYFSVVDNKYSYGKKNKEYIAVTKKLINAIKNNKVAYYEDGGKMAMGGKVKFADKVKSIKASLLERKKVSPKVQKDYGKTYSPKEAEESAKRIVGAMTAKERLMAKRKKGKK